MFQVFGTIGYKVHFILHRFFVSELYVYQRPKFCIISFNVTLSK